MSQTVYAKGVRLFPAHSNAPDFVKGTIIITPRELVGFIKENPELLTDYNGEKQLKLQLLEGDKGLYTKVDTFKPSGGGSQDEDDEPLPF